MTPNPFPLTNTWMRYVILFHSDNSGKQDHYDILLEIVKRVDSEQLALDKLECSATDLTIPELDANPQGLIRRRYLTYEGSMSRNRGFVRRVDEGRYQLTESSHLVFDGKILSGNYFFSEREPDELYIHK